MTQPDPDVTDVTPDESRPADQAAIELRTWPTRWQGPFLEQLAQIPSISAAARYAGISREHASRVRRSDPVFAAACAEALLISRDLADRMVYMLGVVGEERVVTRETVKVDAAGKVLERQTVTERQNVRSPNLLIAWLKAHYPERYSENVELRHTGADGGPVKVETWREGDRQTLEGLVQLYAAEQGLVIEGTSRELSKGSSTNGGGSDASE
jgi:hypothetical protein